MMVMYKVCRDLVTLQKSESGKATGQVHITNVFIHRPPERCLECHVATPFVLFSINQNAPGGLASGGISSYINLI